MTTSRLADIVSGPLTEPLRPSGAPTRRRWSRRVAIDVVGLFDCAVVVLAVVLTGLFYATFFDMAFRPMQAVQSGLGLALIVHICLRSAGNYDVDQLHALPARPLTLLSCLFIALIAVRGLGLPFAPTGTIFWLWALVWMLVALCLMSLIRFAAACILSRANMDGRFDTRVAVFGAGAVARRVHDHLSNGITGVRFVGVFDDRACEDRLNPDGLTVSGRLDDLVVAARDDKIDKIIIALPQQAEGRITTVARRLEHLPVSIHIVTHLASDLIAEGPAYHVSNLGAVGLLDVKTKPLSDWSPIVKRAEDLLIASVLLVLALPLMAIIALAIRINSPGTVFFTQRRRGLNGRVFNVLKFRTMSVLEDDARVSQARVKDPRVTSVGWFLRRTSLDELPQLWNVLRGDMSLVGPRPHALVHDDMWGEMLERYANRHQVKPGITGLAQVRGWRGATETIDKLEHRVACDLEYIAKCSLWLDLWILLQTIRTVLGGRNAH